jgi:hypothetical protein
MPFLRSHIHIPLFLLHATGSVRRDKSIFYHLDGRTKCMRVERLDLGLQLLLHVSHIVPQKESNWAGVQAVRNRPIHGFV